MKESTRKTSKLQDLFDRKTLIHCLIYIFLLSLRCFRPFHTTFNIVRSVISLFPF
jgi:hypothetical protein